jgi:hypothetical protein
MSLASHWAEHFVWAVIDTIDSPCDKNSTDPNIAISSTLADNIQWVVFKCRLGHSRFHSLHDLARIDLVITVNFTTLGINAPFPSSTVLSTVSIVVGLHTDNIPDVIDSTWAIPLLPDAHLIGGVIPTIRKQFMSPKLASLGGFNSVRPSVHVFSSHHY